MAVGLKFFSVILISCLFLGCFSQTIVLSQTTLGSADNLSNQVLTNTQNPVTSSNEAQLTFHNTILINDNEGYFYLQILSSNQSVLVKVLDQNLDTTDIQLNKQHPVKYIDSFKNYILVKQVNNQTQTKQQSEGNVMLESIVAYYVYSIQRVGQEVIVMDQQNSTQFVNSTTLTPTFVTRQKLINSTMDSSSFPIPQGYVITQILQVDEVNSLMYVVMKGLLSQTTVIYQIDLKQNQPQLNIHSWFIDSNLNTIYGNSMVIVDLMNQQLMIQSNQGYQSVIQQTIYTRKNFSQLTGLNFSTGFIDVVNMQSSAFLVFSLTSDLKEFNAFLYHGYGENNETVKQVTLNSTKQIKAFYDTKSYNIIVGSDDLVWIEVSQVKNTMKKPIFQVSKLSQQINNQQQRISIINDFQQTIQLFYINKEAHLLIENKYIVYSHSDSGLFKVYEEVINNSSKQYRYGPNDLINNNRKLLRHMKSYKLRQN